MQPSENKIIYLSVIGVGKPWYGPFSIFADKIEI